MMVKYNSAILHAFVSNVLLCAALCGVHTTTTVSTEKSEAPSPSYAVAGQIAVKPAHANISDILQAAFPIFYGLVKKAGFSAQIENMNEKTVFAPTDQAFKRLETFLGQETYENIINNNDKLRNLISLHIFPGKSLLTKIKHEKMLEPFKGRQLALATVNGILKINDTAAVVEADIIGSNGIVHGIDAVLIP